MLDNVIFRLVVPAMLLALVSGCSDKLPVRTLPEPPAVKKATPAGPRSTAAPMDLPPHIQVESSIGRAELWKRLGEKEKNLAYHLLQAARVGRTLLFAQTHRHSVAVRDLLVDSVSRENIKDTKALLGDEGFKQYLVYSAKFLDGAGPYAPSKRKYVLTKVDADQVRALLDLYSPTTSIAHQSEIVRLLTDPQYEVLSGPIADEDRLEDTGSNLYEKGITKEEVLEAQGKSLKLELNCRVVRREGKLGCDIHTTQSPGLIGETLRQVRFHIRKAQIYSSSEMQKKQLGDFIQYLEEGHEKDFKSSSIAWVKDGTSSTVDFVPGWVETYEDWLNTIGSWETFVLIVDREVTDKSKALAGNAQIFENAMPYDYVIDGEPKSFKKIFPPGYSPPAILGYYLSEIATIHSAGFNLPNYDDIRNKEGFKNVIKLPLPGAAADPKTLLLRRQVVESFTPKDRVEEVMEHYETVNRIHVLLHEIIGHGSGTFDPAKYGPGEEPIQVLGALGGSMEEQRADLAALVFHRDPKMVDFGLVADAAQLERVKKAYWDLYLGMHFSAYMSSRKSLNQAHIRGRLLFVNHLLEAGAIEWASLDGVGAVTLGNQVLRVKDYEKCHAVAVKLLGELQRIKATRDDAALKAIYAKYAPTTAIQEPWAQALIERGRDLVSFYGSIEQPWEVASDRASIQIFGDILDLESIATHWAGHYR